MLYNRIRSSQASTSFVNSATDLLQETSRKLIYLILSLIAAWQVCSGLIWNSEFGLKLFPVSLGIILFAVLAWYLTPRNLLVAQTLLLVGLAAGIGLYAIRIQQPILLIALSVVPLMASVTIGWQGGVGGEILLVGIVIWQSHLAPEGGAQGEVAGLTIAFGAVLGTVGWIAISSLMTVTEWAVFSYREASEKMERARDRQLELLQVQHDLLSANNELARLSDRLKIMTHLAEEARRVKQEFVANVSHELRTPLNMIIGFTETIVHSPRLYGKQISPKLMADISAIHRNSLQLINLINDVLDLSQIEGGQVVLNKKWNSLDRLVQESISSVQVLFNSKGLFLRVGKSEPDLEVYCDSTRIREVLLNLLSNAGRYTDQGGVCVEYGQENERVVISVKDTGPGISAKDQERLFQPFYQIGSDERRYEGSGLGLSISKRFVEMHGGVMWLESEIGQGTTFFFSLPYERATAARAAASGSLRWVNEYAVKEPRTRAYKAPVPVVRPLYILLERGSALRRLFQRFESQIEIRGVTDVEKALVELQRSPAQGLIVNRGSINFDGIAGNPLLFNTPVITCAVTGEEDISQQLGVARYLIKPITREQILDAIDEVHETCREILVINPSAEELQLFVRILESSEKGFRILRSTHLRQAMELLQTRRPDLVLLNLSSGDQQALQFLARKAQDEQIAAIPVILITAQDPAQSMLLGNSFEVHHGSELAAVDFINCLRAVTAVLAPISEPASPKPPEGPPGGPASE